VGMPQPVVDRIYQAWMAALNDPETAKKLGSIGFDVSPLDGRSFKQDMERELAANDRIVKTLNIKIEN
jgi:tripartite-type tricarboxylate transporter receptor subunit TctC